MTAKILHSCIAFLVITAHQYLYAQSHTAFVPTYPNSHSIHHRGFNRDCLSTKAKSRIHQHANPNSMPWTQALMIRGGSGVPLNNLLLSITDRGQVAKFLAVVTILNGALTRIAPKSIAGIFAHEKDGDDSSSDDDAVALFLIKADGIVLLGHGISLYLATAHTVPMNNSPYKAIGFGLLFRLIFSIKSLICDFDRIGMKKNFVVTNTLVMSWVTLSLLTGVGNPSTSAKLFSCMSFLKGLFLYLTPVAAARKYFGMDIAAASAAHGFQKNRTSCRYLGQDLVLSAIFMVSLAFGVDPLKAAGLSTLIWSMFLFDLSFVSKLHKSLGASGRLCTYNYTLFVFAVLSTFGLLG